MGSIRPRTVGEELSLFEVEVAVINTLVARGNDHRATTLLEEHETQYQKMLRAYRNAQTVDLHFRLIAVITLYERLTEELRRAPYETEMET